MISRIRERAAPFGLNLVAAIPVEGYDGRVASAYRAGAIAAEARSIVVIGSGGRAFWDAVKRHAERHDGWWQREHPLDDFTRAVVENEIAPDVVRQGVDCKIVYPFTAERPTLNFIELARAAGLAGPTILGVVAHPSYGPWIAFRAALLVDVLVDTPGDALGFDPCPSCVARPCITACPGGAVAYPKGWDIPKCLVHRVEQEADCAGRCHARVACVLGPEHRYSDEELAYHQMRALRSMRPYYDAHLKRQR